MQAMNEIAVESLLPSRRDLPTRPAGNELLVREPEDGRVHFLNATATMVWDSCDGMTTIRECAERLRRRFAVPADTDLIADIRAMLGDLSARGLLEKGEEREGV